MTVYEDEIQELVTQGEQFALSVPEWHAFLTDTMGVSVSQLVPAKGVALSDEVETEAVIAPLKVIDPKPTELLSITTSIGINGIYGRLLTQLMSAGAGLTSSYGQLLADTLELGSTVAIYDLVQIVDAVGLSEAISAGWQANQSISEDIEILDVVARFLGVSAEDTLAVVDTVLRRKQMVPTLTQAMEIADVVTRNFLIRVVETDEIEITPEQAIQALYNPVLADALEIVSVYVDPSGGLTAWAVNTTTGAVSEYTNYYFNSYAAMGKKYLGASEEGLFELDGDTDAGDAVIARIKSGNMQFAEGRHASIKGVYIAVRGAGNWVLKIVANDDKTYIYSVSASSMKTTRINIGKGLRARYFSYELISAGQDFDLDSIEFLPIVNSRRV